MKSEKVYSLDFSTLQISSHPEVVFEIVCEWLYTGKLPPDHNAWLDIYIMADSADQSAKKAMRSHFLRRNQSNKRKRSAHFLPSTLTVRS